MKRLIVLAVILLITTGCARGVVHDSLDANNPAQHQSVVGRPPVPPESLTITPTGIPPAATSEVKPEPIQPRMDDARRYRLLPPGVPEPESQRRDEPSPAQPGHEGHNGAASGDHRQHGGEGAQP